MKAYKCLLPGGVAPFTGFVWPQPAGGEPGHWVDTTGDLESCRNGAHVCRVDHLPHWLGPVLWSVEVDGELVEAPDHVVARRARLLAPVDGWDRDGVSAFAIDCSTRLANAIAAVESRDEANAPALDPDLLSVLSGRSADAATYAQQSNAAVTAYIAAIGAGELAAGGGRGPAFDQGFLTERAEQASWLREALGLQDD